MEPKEPDISNLPPTPLAKTWLAAQEKAKTEQTQDVKESEETNMRDEPEGPDGPEPIVPVDPTELMHLKYTRPLPGQYRTFSIDLVTTEKEINSTAIFRAKCLAAIVGEKIFIETVDEHAQDIKPLSGISKPPPNIREPEKSTTGKVCDLCGADMVFKKGFNQEKKKAWAAYFCSKAGPDIAQELKCSKKPQWVAVKD